MNLLATPRFRGPARSREREDASSPAPVFRYLMAAACGGPRAILLIIERDLFGCRFRHNTWIIFCLPGRGRSVPK